MHLDLTRTAILIAGSLLLTMVGQSHAAPPDENEWIAANPGMAIVVLYREDKLAASAIDYRPYINDVPMAVMPNGTWSQAIVPPGNYDLWLEQYAPKGMPRGVRSRAVANFDWQPDQVYYIKVDSVSMPGLVSRAQGTGIAAPRAREELDELTAAGEPLVYPANTWNH